MSSINPITSKLYTEEFKKFRNNEKFFSIPMFQPEIVSEFKKKFMESEIMILEAQTGAGKSVVAPYHVAELYDFKAKIAMSEPRTVNAVNIAGTLSAQVDSKVGEYVGYMTGASTKTSKNTKITVMTDAILFQQMMKNPGIYDVIIIDEFHERNVNIDMCLALIRKYLRAVHREREYHEWRDSLSKLSPYERFAQEVKEYKRIKEYKDEKENEKESGVTRTPENWRKPTKFLLLSATIYAQKYLDFYKEFIVSHMFVSGRSYPITEIFIEDIFKREELESVFEDIELVDPLIEKMLAPDGKYSKGDIIVFLPGKADILKAIAKYTGRPGLLVGGVYRGAQEKEMETLISATKYKELGYNRRLIFATNIAETGVTIDGLQYVIETGTEKKMSVRKDYDELMSQKIPKSSAKQRCGRVGRTSPGTCFHMYSRQEYEEFKGLGRPLIYTENLENLLIKLLVVVKHPSFLLDFVTKDLPDPLVYEDVKNTLFEYYKRGLVVNDDIVTEGVIVGDLGVDYKYGLLILESFKYDIPEIMIPIVSVYAVGPLSGYIKSKKGLDKYRNPVGEPMAAFMIATEIIKYGKVMTNYEDTDLNPVVCIEAYKKMKELQDKINTIQKELKETVKKTGDVTWKLGINDYLGEDLSSQSDKVVSIFAYTFNGRMRYLPYEKTYETETGQKVSGFDIGPTVDLSVRPTYMGFDRLLKIDNKYIPSIPFVILKKEDLE